jgi:hypothetical protein
MFCAWSYAHSPVLLPERLPIRLTAAKRVLIPLLCLGVAAGLVWNVNVARREAGGAYAWDLPRGAANWLAANTPPGSRVFFPAFDDFPRLFYWDTHNTYLVGLDPTYMTLYDPRLFTLWRQVAQGRVAAPSDPIKNAFGADYVYTERRRSAFVKSVTEDPRFESVYSSGSTLVLRVRPPS